MVGTLFNQAAWGTSPLGRPIAGSVESITALTRAQIRRYYRSRYTASNTVVAVAGNVDHTKVVRLVRKAFSRAGFLADPDAQSRPRATLRPSAPAAGR